LRTWGATLIRKMHFSRRLPCENGTSFTALGTSIISTISMLALRLETKDNPSRLHYSRLYCRKYHRFVQNATKAN